jgi:glycosyltransferase involved in cell wall biosynthesis
VTPVLATAAVLACPSHREPLGRVVLEAWDAGCLPVVYAGSGGAAEVVGASGGGLIYESQTPDCLAAALSRALSTPAAERARMVSKGRTWARANCDAEAYGRALAAIFAGGREADRR